MSKRKQQQQASEQAQKPRKKAKQPLPPPVEADSSDADDPGSEPSTSMSEIADCDLEFFDPAPGDYSGLEALLRHYLDGSSLHCGDFVDAIIQQVQSCCLAGLRRSQRAAWRVRSHPCTAGALTSCVQSSVGTVVKADEDEDAVAVVSVLSTSRHRQQAYMADIQRFLQANCPPGQHKDDLQQVLPAADLVAFDPLRWCLHAAAGTSCCQLSACLHAS